RRSEFLVETAVSLAGETTPVIVDLCCGTGALGVAVAHRLAAARRPLAGPANPAVLLTLGLYAPDLDPAAGPAGRRDDRARGARASTKAPCSARCLTRSTAASRP